MRYLIAILAGIMLAFPATAAASTSCYEDQPCWVWSKQGNKQRGVNVSGKTVVVGKCRYAKLARAHRLDRSTTPLRGDWWARMTCPPSNYS